MIRRERIPRRLAAGVPFAHVPAHITRLFQQFRNHRLLHWQSINIVGSDQRNGLRKRPRNPPTHHMVDSGVDRILTAQKRHARRCTGRRGRMRVREATSVQGQAIEMRCFIHRLAVDFVAGNVLPAEVIDHNVNDVWFRQAHHKWFRRVDRTQGCSRKSQSDGRTD